MLLSAAELALLSRLLDQALDLEPAQIDGWLAALPPDQEHLRPHLRAMLHARMTRIARSMSCGPSLDDEEVDFAGDPIGQRDSPSRAAMHRHKVRFAAAVAVLVAVISGARAHWSGPSAPTSRRRPLPPRATPWST